MRHAGQRRRRRAGLAAGGAALLAFGAGAAPAAGAAATPGGPTTRVLVSPAAVTHPLKAGFLGLAVRYDTVPEWAGNPALAQLVRNLDPSGHVLVRVGGFTGDRTYWPGPGLSEPRGVTYTLSPSWAASARELASSLHAKLLLGINLEADSAPLARYEADQLVRYVGRGDIAAFGLGNEPSLYSHVAWYFNDDGRILPWYTNTGSPVFSRPMTWDPAAYASDYAGILAALPRVPIAGPDIGNPAWYPDYTHRFLSPHSRVRMLVSHGYGLNTCVTSPQSPSYPTVTHMLTRYASDTLLRGLRPYIALAHQDGASFRVDEMGSVTCNGKPGVANTMSSALWAVSALFSVARAGVDGVNLHTVPRISNNLFDFAGRRATVKPLYDGALMFARAAPAGSRLVGVHTSGRSTLRAYATTGGGAAMRVTLVNDDPKRAASVGIQLPLADRGRTASLLRLQAPSVASSGGVTIGGHAVASNGVLPAPDALSVSFHGRYARVSVPAGSAALLTIRR